MNAATPTICLIMIVKNEAHVIERCLRSVLPFVDYAIIHDTGSTDNTVEIIKKCFLQYFPHNMNGSVLKSVKWEDFATNRNMTLAAARDTNADYIFTLDADEVLTGTSYQLTELTQDLYDLPVEYNGTSYTRPALFRNNGTFFYKGMVHEYLECDRGYTRGTLSQGWTIQVYHEGARSQDPNTYLNDAVLLTGQLYTLDPESADYARTQFYVAQSYRDAGHVYEAWSWYSTRAKNHHGWKEEQWYAAFQKAKLTVRAGRAKEALNNFMEAYNMRPTRVEPLFYAAIQTPLVHLKELLLTNAYLTPIPESGLFLEYDVLKWQVAIQLSATYWYTGKKSHGLALTKHLLSKPDLPAHHKKTLEANLKFY